MRKVFCDWYHDDLIYRGKRIVNWCPHCTTAIADDEAEYKEEDGHLWHLRYPLVEPVDGQDYIVVATTRPETMLGDTGVAVSPKDHDKDKFVGAKVKLPIVDREIPIFSDCLRRRRLRLGLREGHACARPERLRHGRAPRP